MQIISNPQKIDFSKLETFVYNHKNANFFQSTKAYYLFESVDNYKPILLVAKENSEIVGSLLSVIIEEGSGLKRFMSRRCIVWGGPLVKDNEVKIASQILKKFKEIVSVKVIYSQFRNLFDTSDFKQIFLVKNWKDEDHLNILIDFSESVEELWKNVNSKRRNEIRRAEREGTTFDVLDNKNDFGESYNILKEVYVRAKLPLPDYTFFEAAYEILFPDYFKVFIALNEERIIGTMYTLCYKGVIYDWYAGSYYEYYKKYPNDLIPWKVFLWGKENGYKLFDFGGAGKPNIPYGVRDYKKKFGGECVNYGRYEKIHKPFLFQMAKLGFKIYQKITL